MSVCQMFRITDGLVQKHDRGIRLTTFRNLFVRGCDATEENLAALFDVGWTIDDFLNMGIPVNGSFRLGNKRVWYSDSKLHREDGPAVLYDNGSEEWWQQGMRHRKNGPAMSSPNGAAYWYLLGKLHRDDGPAVTLSNGTQRWYQHGEMCQVEQMVLT